MQDNKMSNADKRDYIINEFGLELARENIAKQMTKLLENKNQEGFKRKMLELINDRDEINKGNKEIIEKYVGVLSFE